MKNTSHLLCWLWLGIGLLTTGCTATGRIAAHRMDLCQSKLSFLRWNTTGQRPGVCQATLSEGLDLLKESNQCLAKRIECGVGPSAEEMDGAWLGVNKGIAAATAGWMQDIKVFQTSSGRRCGHNVAVYQQPIGDLDCAGWRPKRSCISGELQTLGNFVVVDNCRGGPLTLDYTQADNSDWDPSRFLVDDLVVVQPDLILGRASVCLTGRKWPVAYFILIRRADGCDELPISCDQWATN